MRVLITGGAGMVGRNLVESLSETRPELDVVIATRQNCDLRDPAATRSFISSVRPDAIVHAAARVDGIAAKLKHPSIYLAENLLLDTNVITSAADLGVRELLYVGSAAVYPAEYVRPFVEDDVLTGPLEKANEGYALAKIAGVKLCQYVSSEHGVAYRAILPSNLYGVHDHFDPGSAHLLAAAIGKVHVAKEDGAASVSVWGDGTARREFTFARDLTDWIALRLGELDQLPAALNLGPGVDHSVADYYRVACDVVGYSGSLEFDVSKPSGVPRRLLDSSLAGSFGWSPTTPLREGMSLTYHNYLEER